MREHILIVTNNVYITPLSAIYQQTSSALKTQQLKAKPVPVRVMLGLPQVLGHCSSCAVIRSTASEGKSREPTVIVVKSPVFLFIAFYCLFIIFIFEDIK